MIGTKRSLFLVITGYDRNKAFYISWLLPVMIGTKRSLFLGYYRL